MFVSNPNTEHFFTLKNTKSDNRRSTLCVHWIFLHLHLSCQIKINKKPKEPLRCSPENKGLQQFNFNRINRMHVWNVQNVKYLPLVWGKLWLTWSNNYGNCSTHSYAIISFCFFPLQYGILLILTKVWLTITSDENFETQIINLLFLYTVRI